MKQKKIRKLIAVASAALAASVLMPLGVSAKDLGYQTIDQKPLILTDKDCIDGCNGHTVSGTTSINRISVESGTHNITLDGVDIDTSKTTGVEGCAFSISPGAAVKLTIKGENTLTSSENNAGIYVPDGAKLTINSEKDGKLEVQGGENAAGIGGQGTSVSATAGNIIINGGEIIAKGGKNGTGIGGSNNGGGGNITIEGGTIKATGDSNAGIGGTGKDGSGVGTVNINGGSITAEGTVTNNEGSSQNIGINCNTLSSETGKGGMIIGTLNAVKKDSFNSIQTNSTKPTDGYTVYGNLVLNDGIKLDSQKQNILIQSGNSLSVPKDWSYSGTIQGNGTLIDPDRITGNPTIGDDLKLKVNLSKQDIKLGQQIYYTGSNLTDIVITIKSTREVGGKTYDVEASGWKSEIKKDNTKVDEIKDAGSYTVTYSKTGYDSFTTDTITVLPRPLNEVKNIVFPAVTYNGESHNDNKPTSITYNGKELVEGTDYTIQNYSDPVNAGTCQVTLEGIGNFSGTATASFMINKASLTGAEVEISLDSDVYDGQKKTPTVKVTLDGRTLQENTDYTIAYSDNEFIKAGTITATIQGANNYVDTVKKEFEIKKIALEITSIVAADRAYDGTDQVAIEEITFDESPVISSDVVQVNLEGLKGTIADKDVGDYDEVTLTEVPLTGQGSENYRMKVSEDPIKLDTPVKISKGAPPEAPVVTGSYTESAKDDSKFVYTITLSNASDAKYEYRMDGDEWQDSSKFDKIKPDSTHTFEARTKETGNFEAGKIGKLENVVFSKLPQDAPEAFTLEFTEEDDGTFTAVIPKVKDAVYSFDGKDFSESNKLTECKPNTSYTGYTKFLETDTRKESAVTSDTQTTPKLVVETPVISPEGSKFLSTQTVTITCETEGADIYYTTDGQDPSTSSTKYTEPITIDSSVTVRAIGAKEGMDNSSVASANFVKAGGDSIQSKLVITDGIPEVPAGLENTESNSIEAITSKMTRILTSIDGYTYLNMAFYDIKIQISADGVNWEDATVDNFPKEGVAITMPYPEGTGKSTHDFVVCHMFTVTSERLGITAGDTEEPAVTKTDEGLKFTVKGTSPVAIAWKDAAQSGGDNNSGDNGNNNGDNNNNNGNNAGGNNNTGGAGNSGTTGNDGNNGINAASDGTGGTGTSSGSGTNNNGSGSGNNSDGSTTVGASNQQASGDGTTNTGSGVLSSLLPKTGDTTSILIWVALGVVSVAAVIAVIIKKRR